jgi:hypothetical protein
MEPKDNEQYSTPQDQPKATKNLDPQFPGDEREAEIRSGAAETDQLDKLQPKDEADMAPNELGNPPTTHVNKGDGEV